MKVALLIIGFMTMVSFSNTTRVISNEAKSSALDLPRSIEAWQINGANNITGDIADLPDNIGKLK